MMHLPGSARRIPAAMIEKRLLCGATDRHCATPHHDSLLLKYSGPMPFFANHVYPLYIRMAVLSDNDSHIPAEI
jgi:hypothetical protein